MIQIVDGPLLAVHKRARRQVVAQTGQRKQLAEQARTATEYDQLPAQYLSLIHAAGVEDPRGGPNEQDREALGLTMDALTSYAKILETKDREAKRLADRQEFDQIEQEKAILVKQLLPDVISFLESEATKAELSERFGKKAFRYDFINEDLQVGPQFRQQARARNCFANYDNGKVYSFSLGPDIVPEINQDPALAEQIARCFNFKHRGISFLSDELYRDPDLSELKDVLEARLQVKTGSLRRTWNNLVGASQAPAVSSS